jgi:TonB-dependent Receptor Plug Domain.
MEQLIRQIVCFGAFCLCFIPGGIAQNQNNSAKVDTVSIKFFTDSIGLEEVVVKTKKTPSANSRWSDISPVELATQGGANGNLYKALQTLPGTQVQGESGKLLVRGGDSDEVQTYIDGMHVLNPYTAAGINTPVRARYSTFMFSGINLATGGAPLEYGDALSAALPLDTKDKSVINKLGINLSSVGLGGGGTKAFSKGSLSTNFDYQNLDIYDRLYPGRVEFEKPYRMASGAAQFRYHPDEANLFKLYVEYDRTDFSNYAMEDNRLFSLGENNFYLNTTYTKRFSNDWSLFAGAAYSYYRQNVGGAVVADDSWMERQQEVHLKTKISKRISPVFRVEGGVESFLRQYDNNYENVGKATTESSSVNLTRSVHPAIYGGFVTSTFYPFQQLKTELSLRTEYTRPSDHLNISPRFAINYYWDDLMLSATLGRYTQLPQNEYLIQSSRLLPQVCDQYNIGGQYKSGGRFYKAEIYYKKYTHLPLITPMDSESSVYPDNVESYSTEDSESLASTGYGYSKGVDLFFNDRSLLTNFEYQLSYTYNISKRKYAGYTELVTPQYATRHNIALVVKYSLPRLRSIIGLTDQFASGRPYHNPNLPGVMNDEVKPYNSLDLGVTFLPSRKVIIHASATNILCRKNEFGRTNDKPVLASSDHFFYIGVFVTLGKKAAYDVSNF